MLSRPQLGVCTWTFGDWPLPEAAAFLAELDFDGVELSGDLSRYTAREAGQILQDHNLTVFSLTPQNVDLAHPDTAVRQQALDYYGRLLDFATELGNPLVSVHGYVGRVRPLTTLAEERELLVTAVRQIARRARQRDLPLVFELLNRYETHLINTGDDALQFLNEVGEANVAILLDAFHMNIEEQDMSGVMRRVGDKLGLYHMADSNRQAIGRGHIKLGDHLWALEDIGYAGPIIFECTVPNSDPFAPVSNEDELTLLKTYYRESRNWF
ncbi:MAG TPA: sugar phosphate isomerase/epimerase [Anaerolineae bacterium]|nr:sugar phosphate isomerase/epimerase [Anaerolineae bacterium]